MKKIIAPVMALALCASMAVPASAASFNQDSTAEAGTAFTFDYKNDPTYTVTIPETLAIEKEGTRMEIKADDVAYLDGQKISVTIAGTDKYRDQMVLEGKSESGRRASIRYRFVKEDGQVIETKGDGINGTEIASFTDNGTVGLNVQPIIEASSSIIKGVTYTGSMTYGIALADAE